MNLYESSLLQTLIDKLKSVLIFCIAIVVIVNLGSCDPPMDGRNDCDGITPSVVVDSVITTGFTIGATERSLDPGLCNGASSCYVNYNGGDIAANDLKLYINPITMQVKLQPQEQIPNSFSIINNAYACLPAISFATKHEVAGLKVFSQSDYNSNYPINTNLTHLLEVSTGPTLMTLDSFIVHNKKSFLLNQTDIAFNTSPATASKHVLSFIVTLEDSSQITFKTDTLRLH